MRPVLKLRTRRLGFDSVLTADSPEAEAFFALIKDKKISARELPIVAKVGFTSIISGEIALLAKELDRLRLSYERTPSHITYQIDEPEPEAILRFERIFKPYEESISPACERSKAFISLIRDRRIGTSDLYLINKMGFEAVVTGETLKSEKSQPPLNETKVKYASFD